jgi:hypothetical protein
VHLVGYLHIDFRRFLKILKKGLRRNPTRSCKLADLGLALKLTL